MQFYDEVTISVESGKGGDGIASGRRESGIPFGGPSGGDGGDGGSVFFLASKDENTLIDYKYKKHFKAKPGEPGRTKDQYGAHGEDLELVVPVGTMIKDTESGRLLAQLEYDGQRIELLQGGEGGFGNIHFKDSVNQYPNYYLLGEPGQKKNLTLELQLLADVGLIGSPSVGKSSLINCMADVKAKVADYPFTTLVPNLGSVSVGDYRFNVIDIPGLIAGASEGKGLGNAFLRHVLKARVFAFVADLSRFESGIEETIGLFGEIMAYIEMKFGTEEELNFVLREEQGLLLFEVEKGDELLLSKKILIVLNKWDLLNDEEILKEYQQTLYAGLNDFLREKGLTKLPLSAWEANTFVTSAGTYAGVGELLRKFAELLQKSADIGYHPEVILSPDLEEERDEEEEALVTEITEEEKPILIEEGYIEELESRFSKVRLVQNPEISKMTCMIPWGNDQAEQYFWQQMQSKGFLNLLEAEGVMKGDVLKIRSYYEGLDDKYLLY
ncbi:MAG: GTPase ObgE [candidate division SR1 bacterium]|nr:MAG: GTPase ObgE [candidate division SR1 bacterium]